MKNILYLILFLMPVLLEAQNRADVQERLLLPKTPRRYFTQKNHQWLLSIDREMARRRAFLNMQLNLNTPALTEDVTIPVVVYILYKAGASPLGKGFNK